MNILAFDTATEACTVGLLHAGQYDVRTRVEPATHAIHILPMIDEVLVAAGLDRLAIDAIAFGCGPGSFTGLRIAASIAQGLSLPRRLPIVPVSSLQILAQTTYETHHAIRVVALLDARMQEVYVGTFQLERGLMQPVGVEQVIAPTHCKGMGEWFAAGPGYQAYASILQSIFPKGDPHLLPDAGALLRLAEDFYQKGRYVTADAIWLMYLRNNVVDKTPAPGRTMPPILNG